MHFAARVDVRTPDPGRVGRPDRGEDVVHVAPGGDVLAGLVAVDALGPGEPVAVHLPVEAEEEGMAPVARVFGPFADVGVVGAGDHVGELEVGLFLARGDRLRAPAEDRDRAMPADRLDRRGRKAVEGAGGGGAVGKRGEEVDQGEALAAEFFKSRDGVHVPRRLRAGDLVADRRPPVDGLPRSARGLREAAPADAPPPRQPPPLVGVRPPSMRRRARRLQPSPLPRLRALARPRCLLADACETPGPSPAQASSSAASSAARSGTRR